LVLPVLVLAVLSGSHPARAADVGTRVEAPADQQRPLDLVKASVARVLGILQSQPSGTPLTGKRRAEIRRAAEDLFDFDEMARRVLASHWKEQAPQEQAEFVRLFVDVLERSYLSVINADRVTAVAYRGESVTGPYAQVRSRVATERQGDLAIDYRLLQNGARWRVYDVVADGVSIVSSYRSQFNTIIRTSSFADLLEQLRSREARAAALRQGL
jgi:phospholipid transport system substrate-binding protein